MFKLNKPQDWESITLSELEKKSLLLLRNGFPCGSNNEQEIGIPQLRPMNVDNSGKIDLHQVKFIQVDKIVNNYLIKENDIIFNNTNSHDLIGKTAIWTGPSDKYVLSNHMTFLRLLNDSKIDQYFLAAYFYFLWINRYFESIRRQHVNQASISLERLRDVELPIPPLPEQRAISRVLRAVQQAREARLREIALERERKAALMEHLFRHGTRGEATKETEIGEMPESWNLISCEKLCEKITVGVVVRPSSYYVSSGVPAFRSFNIREDRIEPNDLVYFSHEANDTILSKSKIRTGDVLIVRTGYTGTASVVPKEFDGANCIDLVIARPNQSLIKGEYLSRYLNSSEGKRQALAAEIGLAQKHLNVGAVNRMQIPLPPKEEQHEIAELLNTCDAKIAALEHEARLHDELFRAVLEELMTGRLRAGSLAEKLHD
jgi:type I restriction enzyme, S subunit